MSQKYVNNVRRWESSYFESMDVDPIMEWKIHGNPHWKGRYLSESEKLDLGLYGTIETVENNRFNEVARDKGVKKKDLMNSLNDKYFKSFELVVIGVIKVSEFVIESSISISAPKINFEIPQKEKQKCDLKYLPIPPNQK